MTIDQCWIGYHKSVPPLEVTLRWSMFFEVLFRVLFTCTKYKKTEAMKDWPNTSFETY